MQATWATGRMHERCAQNPVSRPPHGNGDTGKLRPVSLYGTDGITGTEKDINPPHNAGITESDTVNRTATPVSTNMTNTTPTHNAQYATDLILSIRGVLKEVRETAQSASHTVGLEARLTMLEDYMARFAEDQRRIAETMRCLEMGMSRLTPETQPDAPTPTRPPQRATLSGQHRSAPEDPPTDNAHHYAHTDTPNITDCGARGPAPRESPSAGNHRAYRNVHFDNTSPTPHTAATSHSCVLQQSFIPYDEIRTVRYSLPEFHGTTPEDPVRFIHRAEATLYTTQIERTGWTSIIESQLKGAAGTWWNTVRLLDYTWDEFRANFLKKFNSMTIQARLQEEVMTVRQSPTQSLTDFISRKHQLTRRINNGQVPVLAEPQLVHTIVD